MAIRLSYIVAESINANFACFMDLDIKGKLALVTGGAEGIGEAIARALAAEGARVVILDRNREMAQIVARDIIRDGGFADLLEVELTDDSLIAELVAFILDRFGSIDIIVNNAGVNDVVRISDDVNSFRASIERNLVHVFALVHHSLEALKTSKGCIVNIGSKVSATGQGGTSGYAAAKGAIASLTREWAVDLAPFGIRVNCVVPAEVMTPLYQRILDRTDDPIATLRKVEAAVPFGHRMTTPKEIAETVAFIASPRSSHTTGQILYVDGGYTHLDRKFTTDNE